MVLMQTQPLTLGYRLTSKLNKIVIQTPELTLESGSFVALIGRNGSGKSTLLKTLSNFLPALQGKIYFHQQEIEVLSRKQLAHILSHVFTGNTIVGNYNVFELVSLGRYPYSGLFGLQTTADKKIIYESLEILAISHLVEKKVSELSDGERQKVYIARALAQDTPMIFFDEPTSHLDYPSRFFIFELLQKLSREYQKAILVTTHELDLALQYAKSIWLIDRQKKLYIGEKHKPIAEAIWQDAFTIYPDLQKFSDSIEN